MTAAAVDTKTEVFTKAELDALRKALNHGKNGTTYYATPMDPGKGDSDDWKNDVSLLVKFMNDLRDVMKQVVQTRFPEPKRKQFLAILENLQSNMDEAIVELRRITAPEEAEGLWDKLKKVGLVGDELLAKLDEFRDRITNGPLVSVLEMGDTIMGSLSKVLPVLEPLKEAKEVIENRVKHGSDDEIIRLGLY